MKQRKLTLLGAALLGATLAASVGAQDQNRSGYQDSGDRGVITPANTPDMGNVPDRGVSGTSSRMPSLNQPASVPDNNPDRVGQIRQSPLVRDSRFLASPITPKSVDDNNPSLGTNRYSNDGGMGIGATR